MRGANTGSPEEIARFTNLFEKYSCIYGTQSEELACYLPFNTNVKNHLKTLIPLARKYNRKFIWTVLLSDKYFIWNKLLTDGEMAAFMKANYDTFLPMEKSVSVDDIMLNWADCVGMWLSGYSSAWSFKFDSFYYENYIIAEKGMAERDKHQYYPSLGKNVARFYRIACPSYLLKDSMILAALTGRVVLQTSQRRCLIMRPRVRFVQRLTKRMNLLRITSSGAPRMTCWLCAKLRWKVPCRHKFVQKVFRTVLRKKATAAI
jgi:hypothetical protein